MRCPNCHCVYPNNMTKAQHDRLCDWKLYNKYDR